MPVVGILLAAGKATRFGGDKLLTEIAGEPIGVIACRHLRSAVHDVVAVVRVRDRILAAALAKAGARVLPFADAERGIGASLAFGARSTVGASGWVIALADMPWIRSDTFARVAAAVENGASIAAPFHHGLRGHPVGFSGSWGAALMALDGDEGAKRLLAGNDALVTRLDVDDPGVLRDVDSPADLAP